ncbi:redox-sensing transcriptional repressor Rex [bacterium]|nr:redox-sensing transcriptional repressor Rex [bacterium]MBR1775628.1 redox-sensing transcriptional repressor Rex [bacterium]
MNIPDKVINRLSLYHFIIEDLRDDEQYVTSAKIAQLLDIDDSQVRKDIKFLDNCGKCRVGYDVKKLKAAIEKSLCNSKKTDAFIIGAGNLGSALAKYEAFQEYGLNIQALFDNDPEKIGTIINGKEVFDLTKIRNLTEGLGVEIAILTVPKENAKGTAQYLAEAGIKYIWNFTPCILNVPKDVKVWNENLIGSFLQFTNSDNRE